MRDKGDLDWQWLHDEAERSADGQFVAPENPPLPYELNGLASQSEPDAADVLYRAAATLDEHIALMREAADALADLKRRQGIVIIGRGSCIESRLRWTIMKLGGRS
jgi:beta-phosphoglucomutase-like phosphatase (HAD superfamily)